MTWGASTRYLSCRGGAGEGREAGGPWGSHCSSHIRCNYGIVMSIDYPCCDFVKDIAWDKQLALGEGLGRRAYKVQKAA